MAKKAEVEIGGYMADVELTKDCQVIIRINGCDFTERLFERFVASRPRMNLIELENAPHCAVCAPFKPQSSELPEGRCFP